MMWNTISRAALASLLLALVAGCGDSTPTRDLTAPQLDPASASASLDVGDEHDDDLVYDQVDFLGNPLVSEVTIVKANHEAYNKMQPYATATFRPQTEKFVTDFKRPQELATLLGSVLYPDVLVVDPTKAPSTAGWLSERRLGRPQADGRRGRRRPHRDLQLLPQRGQRVLRAVRAAALHRQRRRERQGLLPDVPVPGGAAHLTARH